MSMSLLRSAPRVKVAKLYLHNACVASSSHSLPFSTLLFNTLLKLNPNNHINLPPLQLTSN